VERDHAPRDLGHLVGARFGSQVVPHREARAAFRVVDPPRRHRPGPMGRAPWEVRGMLPACTAR
jgi:hypothetical protein